VCHAKFTPSRPLQVVCAPKCAIELSKANDAKREKKEWSVKKKAIKEKLKTLGQYEKEARDIFQKWIRYRDKDLPCISCGNFANRYDGGHYFKAELYSGLIFNEDNVNKQCSSYCNKNLHGNEANYRVGLVKKIGEERVRWLEENKDRLRTYKYTKEQLVNIKEDYKQRLKEEFDL